MHHTARDTTSISLVNVVGMRYNSVIVVCRYIATCDLMHALTRAYPRAMCSMCCQILTYLNRMHHAHSKLPHLHALRCTSRQWHSCMLIPIAKSSHRHQTIPYPTSTLPWPKPTLAHLTLPCPTLPHPYPALTCPTLLPHYPTLPYPTLPYPSLPFPSRPFPSLPVLYPT